MLRRLIALLREQNISAKTMHSFVGSDYRNRTNEDPIALNDSYDWDWTSMLNMLDARAINKPAYDSIVIDEGQDLPEGFFRYAKLYGAPVLTVFADENQALHERRTTLLQIKQAADLPDPVMLTENHRNSPEIAALAEHFHSGRIPAALVRRARTSELPRLIRSRNLLETAQRIARLAEIRGGTIGIIVQTNELGAQVHTELRRLLPNRRVDIYDSDLRNEDSIELLSPGVTVLNVRSVKGQEFDTVFVLGLDELVPCTTPTRQRVMYMVCTRARDTLFLVHGPEDLSPMALASLPDNSRLERG
jgi:superfamily I DNA/RNA helicase